MNVLVLGSGGREHALCKTLSKSKSLNTLYAIPGNPGMSEVATSIDIDPLNNNLVREFVLKNNITLVIPGSEVYLENGISDVFKDDNVFVFGPDKQSAQIESSKEFAKDLMKKYQIPTATYEVFDNYHKAITYVEQGNIPTVIKYDGLAGGKGVVVAMTLEEAKEALKTMLLDKKYGESKVIIEEYLEGPEFSLMCFVHNGIVVPMPIAQDHKRLLDNDKGPNTGGMGIYSTVPIIPNGIVKKSLEEIMIPTVNALKEEKCNYTGFLYGGLMLTKNGPKVIEFNARFGDPEAEVILPKLESDFLEIINTLQSNITPKIKWSDDFVVGVVLASKGYPNSYQKGFAIEGLDTISDEVFHMGTKKQDDKIYTNGGRVLLVTGTAKTLEQAITNTYNNVNKIQCENLIYRIDIGAKSIKR